MLYRNLCKLFTHKEIFKGGIHLLSRAVSSKVPSAVYVLTIVFGMGTGVSHKRIDTTDCDHLASCFAARLVRTSLPARLVRSLTNLAAA